MSARENHDALSDTISFIHRIAAGERPLAVIVAGHNGSGKSTMWFDHFVDEIKAPMINADRIFMSVLLFDIRESVDVPVDVTGWLDIVVPPPMEEVLRRKDTQTDCAMT